MTATCDQSKNQLAEVVLYAEFDIDKGSTLRESYPYAFDHYSSEFFADVMLPEGIHNREDDFTVFFLNRKSCLNTNHSSIKEDEKKPVREFMYCQSVVRTTHDNMVRRGASVKAVAVCSQYKWCFSLKQLLDLAVRKITGAQDSSASTNILHELYHVINSISLNGIRNLSEMERRLMKRTITSRPFSNVNWKATEDSLYHSTVVEWDEIKIPLRFKLCSTLDQHDDGLLSNLIATFGEQTMSIYNAVLSGARVIVLGYNQPAGRVCSYVLAMSALICPPLSGLSHRQFPYANLNDLSFLSVPGYIAGVTNPMFKSKREWWDVLCDITTSEVFTSWPNERDEFEVVDKTFLQDVMDGMRAGFPEEWIRCRFEEFTSQNVVEVAFDETEYLDSDLLTFFFDWENVVKTGGADVRKHIRKLQGDKLWTEEEVERMYTDFVSLLQTEQDLQEFLSHLPFLRGGLESIAQGLFHSSISVKYNTIVLLKRLERYQSTQSSLKYLNPFIIMSYQRIHQLVEPDVRQEIN
ncbi:unnamed protein product [Albugo candida]|uniref:UDENN domain-containing protein n=1 Tax=Albugo candida TaxID=65357 RepID=A0A024GCC7_9STRA|nr:unnamed protein product [Albugo candida]|eukprot:CCI44504.1 unnamed protein product [Albugo candida]